ncbi:MAG: ABC transporter ATP-binding protein [Clostridia bacterium]|nr:ABC transporter ATP-binding protein [Clostridia bacterium]
MQLKIENIHKFFGSGDNRTEVLKGISCTVYSGSICVLLGPSGSGKSTLLNIIGGIETADEGTIYIGDEKIENMSEKKLSLYRRKHLGYVFQAYNLVPDLTVKENIEVGAYLSDDPMSVDDMLNMLGLWEHKDKMPNQLSGGQQQRTSIGRAIIKRPDILLCDEPTGALDYKTSKDILKLIEEVNKTCGNTIIMVTHNDALKNMADKVIKLRDGAVRSDKVNETKIAAQDLDW